MASRKNSRRSSPPWSPESDHLVRLSEHLRYEMAMTFSLASRLGNGAGTAPNVDARNAEVEAFAMHLRLLIEFFWIEKPQTEAWRNAFAADYFPPKKWGRLRPKQPDALKVEFYKRIGWGAAHLTYNRVEARQDAWWDVRQHVVPLARASKCFITNVDPQKLAPGVGTAMSECVGKFLARFPDPEASEDG